MTRVPEGVYFTELKQQQQKITLKGAAQSDARVSSLMNKLEESEWLKSPAPTVIEAANNVRQQQTGRDFKSFELQVTQTAPKRETDEEEEEL